MKEPVRAVIFDMYETLVTQLRSPLYYGTQIAGDLGLAPGEFLPGWRETEKDRSTGKLTFENTMTQLMERHNLYSRDLHSRIAEKRMAFQRDCFRQLHPQILPMLETLKEKGIRIGLITNCFSEEAALIRESVLFPFFDAACLSWEEGICKPDPVIFHTCLDRLAVPAESCLYVGDGGSRELETAKSLGMQPLQAVWYRQEAFEHCHEAIRPELPQLKRPMDLLTWIR